MLSGLRAATPSLLKQCPGAQAPRSSRGGLASTILLLPLSQRTHGSSRPAFPSPRAGLELSPRLAMVKWCPPACQEGTPAPDAYTISLHAALSTSPRDKRQAARGGSGQPRGPTRAGLWASTRRQRTANKEWSTRRSNSRFWRSWQPETCSPTKRQEVVAPTPRDKSVHPEPVCAGDGLDTAPTSSAHTPPQPNGAEKSPAKRGSWRKRRQRPGATAVQQLRDLAPLLSSKPPDDPQLHHAAIALADWVEEKATGRGLGKSACLASPRALLWHPGLPRPSDPSCIC